METVEDFLARGGKIQVIPTGHGAMSFELANCQCGCKGNYVHHRMKLEGRANVRNGNR